MNYELIYKKKGFLPLSQAGDLLICQRRNSIVELNLKSRKTRQLFRLPGSLVTKFSRVSSLLSRLLRRNCLWLIEVSMDNYLYSDRAGVYSCQGGVVKAEFLFTDRRYFLNFLTLDETSLNFSEGMYFGEYFSNPSFLPVFIWFRSKSGAWSKVFSFEEGAINHIHNLYHDPIDNFVWILTGDFDNGPALWRADDNFNDVVKVTPAEQKYRACWIKRFSDNIYWATDTQMEQNSLLKANAKDIEPSVIKKLPGSSIYSVAFNGGVAFSTTLEPERASRRDFMAWLDNKPARKLEPDGAAVYILDEDEVLVEIIRSSPHLLPLRLFEYPTYLFPSNIVESKYLTCYGRSVKSNDDCLLVFKTSI